MPYPPGLDGVLVTRQSRYKPVAFLSQPTLGAAVGVRLTHIAGGTSLTTPPTQHFPVGIQGEGSHGQCIRSLKSGGGGI